MLSTREWNAVASQNGTGKSNRKTNIRCPWCDRGVETQNGIYTHMEQAHGRGSWDRWQQEQIAEQERKDNAMKLLRQSSSVILRPRTK